jgi:2-amino-4-hydroxy-6-hydroxymethyldihydropteridine diphosphokinase
MTRAFIAVGSNIRPAENVRAALGRLAKTVRLVAVSTVYETPAEGRPEQPPYYNCVVAVETDVPPETLKRAILRRIESDLGRQRAADRYAARPIDLDLILYGDLAVETEDLTLPDPLILTRPYLAAGLREVAPGLVLPKWERPVEELSATGPGMKPLEEYTERLRRDLGLCYP